MTTPGRLVLVVGPSGAGKDSVIRAARDVLAGDPGFEFPRRVVTRAAGDDEDNIAVDAAAFDAMQRRGEFALSWRAHGLSYGLPATIVVALAAGRTVVCNVSRTVVGSCRARFPDVLVIEVTASPDVLHRRLVARARRDDGPPERRLARSADAPPIDPDLVIRNEGALGDARDRFVAALTKAAALGGDDRCTNACHVLG